MLKVFWQTCVLLFLCLTANAKTLNVVQWIDQFKSFDVPIFYSTDYITTDVSSQLISLENESIVEFNLALKRFSLQLLETTTGVFIIQPLNNDSPSGLFVHANDIISNKPIKHFRVRWGRQNELDTIDGFLIVNQLKVENLTLSISAEGYHSIELPVEIIEKKYQSIQVALNPLPLALNKITVSTSQTNFSNRYTGKNTFLREDLENATSFNNDPLRATENLPSSTSNGLSGKSRTRGGNENESLIVFDNNILRNPYHFKDFFSLFSSVNLNVVESIDTYSGVFPVQYGGRLSSVLSAQSSDNVGQSMHEVNLSLLNAFYTFRSQSEDFNQQYLLSIRTGGQLIDKHIINDPFVEPEYDDGYFKGFQQINEHWSTSQHVLASRDDLKFDQLDGSNSEEARASYQDQNIWLQLNYNNADRQVNLQVYSSSSHNKRTGSLNGENSISDLSEDILTTYSGIKYSQTELIASNFSLEFGLGVFTEKTTISSVRNINHYGQLTTQLGLDRDTSNEIAFKENGVGATTFINARYQINPKLVFDLGARFEYKDWIDENVLSPRLNISYFFNNKTTMRLGFGRHQQSQYIDEILLDDEIPEYFEPISADVAVFEFNRTLNKHLSLRAELYYKKYSNTQPYYENLFNNLQILPELYFDRIRVTPDDSKASGAEFTLSGTHNKLDWSASYIFSDVDDTFGNQEQPRSWDQHNAFKFNLHMPIKTWHFDLNANYHSGWPQTQIIQTNEGLITQPRNSDTFDDFFQVDMKIGRNWKKSYGTWLFNFQIQNILNTENACCIEYSILNNELNAEQKNGLPIVPNISIGYKWD